MTGLVDQPDTMQTKQFNNNLEGTSSCVSTCTQGRENCITSAKHDLLTLDSACIHDTETLHVLARMCACHSLRCLLHLSCAYASTECLSCSKSLLRTASQHQCASRFQCMSISLPQQQQPICIPYMTQSMCCQCLTPALPRNLLMPLVSQRFALPCFALVLPVLPCGLAPVLASCVLAGLLSSGT